MVRGLFILGLTGGIASGKSAVARELTRLGALVVSADGLAHQAMEKGTPGWEEVRDAFGHWVLGPGGEIDRARLGQIVFNDEKARRRLEGILHPRVIQRMEAITRDKEGDNGLLVFEVPLLFEAGLEDMFDQVWVVAVDGETQAERLMARDGLTEAEAQARIEAQMPLAEKRQRADAVIDNSGGIEDTKEQVLVACKHFLPPVVIN